MKPASSARTGLARASARMPLRLRSPVLLPALGLVAAFGLGSGARAAAPTCTILSVTPAHPGALVATACGSERRQTLRRCDMIWNPRRWNMFCGMPSSAAKPPSGEPPAGVMGTDWEWSKSGQGTLLACSTKGGPRTCYRLPITGDTTPLP